MKLEATRIAQERKEDRMARKAALACGHGA
jgi:hypothetical protein